MTIARAHLIDPAVTRWYHLRVMIGRAGGLSAIAMPRAELAHRGVDRFSRHLPFVLGGIHRRCEPTQGARCLPLELTDSVAVGPPSDADHVGLADRRQDSLLEGKVGRGASTLGGPRGLARCLVPSVTLLAGRTEMAARSPAALVNCLRCPRVRAMPFARNHGRMVFASR
jgi:hypothetical protein